MTDTPNESPRQRIQLGRIRRTEPGAAVAELPQVIEMPFPSERTFFWKPDAEEELPETDENQNGNAEPTHIPVVVTQEVLLNVSRHVATTLDCELGGFLLGNRCRCPNTELEYVIIDQYSPAKFTESTEVNLSFTHEAWAHLSDELSGKYFGKLVVGWYHSHPRMDVFLSRYDMEIQNARFSEPWMSALVLEPEKHRGGFFCWRGGSVNPNVPVSFYELLERNTRESVMAWEHYTGYDPATDTPPEMSSRTTATISASQSSDALALPLNAAEEIASEAPKQSVAAAAVATIGGRSRLWIIVPAFLVIGFALFVAANKLANYFSQEDTPIGGPANTAAAVDERLYLRIRHDDKITYRPLEDGQISVSLTVVNPPPDPNLAAELGGRPAQISKLSNLRGDNQRVRLVTSIRDRLPEMRENREETYMLDVKLFDGRDPEGNFERIDIPLDPEDFLPNIAAPKDTDGEKTVDPTKIRQKDSGLRKARERAGGRVAAPPPKKNNRSARERNEEENPRGSRQDELRQPDGPVVTPDGDAPPPPPRRTPRQPGRQLGPEHDEPTGEDQRVTQSGGARRDRRVETAGRSRTATPQPTPNKPDKKNVFRRMGDWVLGNP